jgi:peptidoglycan/LPS O-acetylase OafA/YrhL
MSAIASRTFYPEIEGIRGLLSLVVLFGHIAGALLPRGEHPFNWYWGSMEVFFCISGFLIGRNFYTSYGGAVSAAYFVNRALRIWPLYYVAWLLCLLITMYSGEALQYGVMSELDGGKGIGLWIPAFFVQNVERHAGMSFEYLALFEHSWSVALEEQFYLLAPFALLVVTRRTTSFVITLAITLVVISVLARYFGVHFYALAARMDAFALGLLLAVVHVRAADGDRLSVAIHRASVYRLLLIMGAILLVPYVGGTYGFESPLQGRLRILHHTIFNPYSGFGLVAFGLVGLTAVGGMGRSWALFRWPFMQALGKISYSTYLLHLPVILVIVPLALRAVGANYLWLVPAGSTATLLLAFATFHLIEKPFLRRKVRGGSRKVAMEQQESMPPSVRVA